VQVGLAGGIWALWDSDDVFMCSSAQTDRQTGRS